MPAPLPTPSGVVKCQLGWTFSGVVSFKGAFLLGYAGGGLDTAQLASVAGVVAAQYATDMVSVFSADKVLTSVTCADLQNPGTVDGAVAVSTPGTRPGTPMTDGICVAVSFSPNRKYRGSRPKIFLPAGVQGDLASGQDWDSTLLGEVDTQWAAFTADIVSHSPAGVTLQPQKYVNYDGPPYTVVSNSGKTRSHSVPTKVDPPGVYAILTAIAGKKVASQRKRLGKPF